MGGGTQRPVTRMWQLAGGGLGDPGVAEQLRSEVAAGLATMPGSLGKVVLIDRGHGVVRGLSLWDSDEALEGSWDAFAPVAAALAESVDASVAPPRTYEVVHTGFRGVRGRAPVDDEVDQMRARVGMLEGGEAASPWVIELFKRHMAEVVNRAPGCVAALLLRDPTRPALLATTIWSDDSTVARMADFARSSMAAIAGAAGASFVDLEEYDVLFYQQPT